MAFKRRPIEDILNDDSLDTKAKVSKIMDIGHEELDSLRDEIDSLTEKLTSANKDLDAAKDKAEKAEKGLTDYKAEQTAKETRQAKEKAYTALLKEAGVGDKRHGAILKVTDFDSIELDKDGKIKGSDKVLEDIKTTYEGFVEKTKVKGADVPTPPANRGGGRTKKDIMDEFAKSNDADALRAAIAANPSEFK